MVTSVLLEPSFADAIAAIAQAPTLSPMQQRHWTCSLRQIANALDRPPESIPGRWTAVRRPMSRLHHAMTGNREKTLQNHKSNVRRALLWFADEYEVPGRGIPLTSAWRALRDGIPDLGRRNRLTGLMRYCCGKAVCPAQVDEAVLDGYMAYRAATTSLDTDATARRRIARAWNACVGVVEDWPALRLIEPPFKRIDGPSWEDFPAGLREDIDGYLTGLMKLRRGARGRRMRPCKPSTIHTRRAELVAVAKTAARIVPPESLTGLRVLLSPDLVEQVLEAYWKADGERPGTFTIDLARKLLSVARDSGLFDAGDLDRLDDMRAHLETYRHKGLTPKNLALIRQVLNREVWSSIVNLPWRLMKQARLVADHAPVKAALVAQLAVAIAILSVAPVRLGNLGRIRLGENLIRPAGLSAPYWLVFPDYDVKNEVPLAVPARSAALGADRRIYP